MARFVCAPTAYRGGVFLLAVAMWAWCFGDARLEEFGWQFRHLEVWALSASALSAAMTLRLSMGWSRSPHEGFVAATAALNAVVIVGYLGPLGAGGAAGPGWQAAYLHLIGPSLQIADALLILGAFSRLGGAVAWVLGLALAYVAWVELAVRPLNASAEGSGGLPYAALNGMDVPSRLAVYGLATLGALAALALFRGLQRARRGVGSGPVAAG